MSRGGSMAETVVMGGRDDSPAMTKLCEREPDVSRPTKDPSRRRADDGPALTKLCEHESDASSPTRTRHGRAVVPAIHQHNAREGAR